MFANPFPGMDKPLNQADLIRALRMDLAAEEEAIHLYTAHASATSNELAKKALISIANEERVHAGEFTRLLQRLDPDEVKLQFQGYDEIDRMLEAMSPDDLKELAR